MSDRVLVVPVQPGDRAAEREFITYPHQLYGENRNWVPWFHADMRTILRRRHPFFEHAQGEFLLARRDGRTVGRICVVRNPRYIEQHRVSTAHFYFADYPDDQEVSTALFDAAVEWARTRGLTHLSGPLLFGGTTGSGVLISGFDQRAAMTMMPYNFAYYPEHMQRLGFAKDVDLLSWRVDPVAFVLPQRVRTVAEKVLARGRFAVMRFSGKRQIKRIAANVASLYNTTLGDHPEDYPLSDAELRQLVKDLLLLADPRLIKILTYDDRYVGYLLAFPDISAAMQRAAGQLTPRSLLDVLRELKRTRSIVINGAGILPEYQRLGGNALLYYELEKTARLRDPLRAELTQVAESTTLMVRDLQTLGAEVYKIHRMYRRTL
ncbi:MAG: hypothetical protein EA384_14870 [Spirochaetaceae bacterium]|nr:MAG: hypothetical protein EA384_14870 [Spirochaetaceae bacterium]